MLHKSDSMKIVWAAKLLEKTTSKTAFKLQLFGKFKLAQLYTKEERINAYKHKEAHYMKKLKVSTKEERINAYKHKETHYIDKLKLNWMKTKENNKMSSVIINTQRNYSFKRSGDDDTNHPI